MSLISKNLRYSLAIFLTSILTSVLVFSETSVKGIIQSWFETCSVIIYKHDPIQNDSNTKSMEVSLYLTGNAPNKFDLIFSIIPQKNILKDVSLSRGGVMRHPHNDLKCGLDSITTANNKGLCSDSSNLSKPSGQLYYHTIAIQVLNIGPSYNYKYIVTYDEKETPNKENLLVSVDFGNNNTQADSKANFCRAEEADFFNIMVWGGIYLKLSILALLIISCIFITTTLKQWINNS